jgi:hypothetical protein
MFAVASAFSGYIALRHELIKTALGLSEISGVGAIKFERGVA